MEIFGVGFCHVDRLPSFVIGLNLERRFIKALALYDEI
jgi:hypothetical protein